MNQKILDHEHNFNKSRTLMMNKMAAVLRSKRQELAELIADEMGKPVTQGLAEVEKGAECEDGLYKINQNAKLIDHL